MWADVGLVLEGRVDVDLVDAWRFRIEAEMVAGIEIEFVRFLGHAYRGCTTDSGEHVVVELAIEVDRRARASPRPGSAGRSGEPEQGR